ncbi:MAG: hypothetical protein M1272_05440 [Firmicutes bacterium]|nr:hypothetical protein [Bacillota bacterium]
MRNSRYIPTSTGASSSRIRVIPLCCHPDEPLVFIGEASPLATLPLALSSAAQRLAEGGIR